MMSSLPNAGTANVAQAGRLIYGSKWRGRQPGRHVSSWSWKRHGEWKSCSL